MKRFYASTFVIILGLAWMLLSKPANAATYSWSGSGGAAWTTASTNWSVGVGPLYWDLADGTANIADFTQGGDTPIVSGGVYVNGIQFDNTANISGATINLVAGTLATPTITVNASGGTIGNILAGNAGLTTAGTGLLLLTGANSYTGTTTIGSGTLQIGSGGTTGSLTSTNIVDNGALVYSLGAANINLPSAGITGTGTVKVTGGAEVLFGGSIATGGSQSWNTTGTAASNNNGLTLANNAALTLTSTGAISMSGMLGTVASAGASTANLTITTSAGNGNVTLNTPVGVSNVHYGLNSLTVNAGNGAITLGTFNAQNWGTINTIALNGGNINSTANFNGFTTLTANVSGTSSTFSGLIAGGGSLNKQGAGMLTITNADTYTNGTAVNGGTLNFLGVAPAPGTISTAAGAVTQLSYSAAVNNPAAGITYTGAGTVLKSGTGSYAYTSGNADTINMSAGGLIDVEQGSWGSNSFSTRIASTNQGSLKIASGATFYTDTGTNGTTTVAAYFDALNGSGTFVGPYRSGTLTLGVAGGSGTWAGVINVGNSPNTWSVTKTGTGTQVFSAVQTYTGGTTVSGGTLVLKGTGTSILPAGTTLAINSNSYVSLQSTAGNAIANLGSITITGGTLSADGTTASQNVHSINNLINLNGGLLGGNATTGGIYGQFYLNGGNANISVAASTSSTITASLGLNNSLYGYNSFTVNSGATLTVSGFLNGVSGTAWGGINKLGSGTMILTYPANGNGQGAELNGGTVIFSNGALHTNVSGQPGYLADFQANSTLQWAAGNTQDVSASSQVKIDDGITATLNPGGNNVTLGTAFVVGTNKTGALNVTGSGTMILNAANTYTGGTTVSSGMLQVGNNSALGAASGSLNINGGALNLAGFTPTVGPVVMSSGLIQGSGALTGSSYTVTGGAISATLAGSAALTQTAGTVYVSGTNTYTGATNINAGTLVLTSVGSISNSSATTIGAAGKLVLGAPATGLTNANNLILNGGTLQSVQDNVGLGGAITINGANVTHTFNSSGTLTVPGTVSASELIVGAGGSGGGGQSGVFYPAGGGGGQVRNLTGQSLSTGAVVVGAGGVSTGGNNPGVSGGSSGIGGNVALGGAGPANNSGHGALSASGSAGGTPSGTAAGGGGGDSGIGANAPNGTTGGAGGAGTTSSVIAGLTGYYGGGGGGQSSTTQGAGGIGGGGAGGVAGTLNTGGGGGGNANGGSGLVVVQYAYAPFAGSVNLNGSINVAAPSTLDAFTSGGSLTVNGIMSGAGGITVVSSSAAGGVVAYTNTNTYSGATIVNAGATLALNSNLAIQNSPLDTSSAGQVTLGSGVTTPTLGGLTSGGNLASVITTGYSGITALSLNPGSGVTASYSGTIADGAAGMALNMIGAGVQILTGSNTYTGPTSIMSGTFAVNGSLASASTVGVSASGTLVGSGVINGAATLTGNGVINLSAGTIGGTLAANGGSWNGTGTVGGLITTSSGQFTIASGADLVSNGGMNVAGGVAVVGSGATLAANGGLNVSGGFLSGVGTITGGTVALGSGAVIAPGASTANGSIGTLTLPSLTASGGTLNFDLSSSTAAGGTNDLVTVSGNLSLPGTTAIHVNLNNIGALTNGNYTLLTYNTLGTYSGSSLSFANSSVLNSRQNYAFDYSSPGSVMLDIIGAAANLTWIGSDGASWDNSGGTTNWLNSLSNADQFVVGDNVAFTNSNSGTVTLNDIVAPASVTVSGVYTFAGTGHITSGTALVVQSPAVLTISNPGNDYTLGTAIQGGSIILGVPNGLPVAGTVTLGSSASAGTLDLAGFNQQIGGLGTDPTATAASQIITTTSGNATLTYSGGASVYGGAIQDTAGTSGGTLNLNVNGGTLDVSSGVASYAGATTVNSATLLVSSLPNTSGITVSSGSLSIASGYNSVAALSVGSAGTATIGGTNLTLAAVSNSGNVSFTSNSGTISLASLSGTGSTSFFSPVASIGTLGSAVVNLNNTALSVTSGTQSAPGSIAGSGSLAMIGSGALVLQGNNTYNGGTSIAGGTLLISGAGVLGGGNYSAAIANSGALIVNSSSNQTFGGVISGTGTLNEAGSGRLTLATNNTLSGAVTVNGGTLGTNAGNSPSGAIGSASSITINSVGTISVGGDNSFVGASTTGSKIIQINAGGALVNSGSSTNHLNAIVLNGGTMSAATANATYGNWNFDFGVSTPGDGTTSTITGGNAALTEVGGTIFNIGASDTVSVSTILAHVTSLSDTGLTKTGSGTLILNAANTYTGGTIVNGGTLTLNVANAYVGPLTVNNGGFVSIQHSNATDNSASPLTINAGGIVSIDNAPGAMNTGGGVVMNGGTLAATATPSAVYGNLVLNAGLIATGNTESVVSASMHMGGTKTFNVADGTAPIDLLVSGQVGNIEGSTWGFINKTGAGTMSLTNSGNAEGGNFIAAGTLIFVNHGLGAGGNGYLADFTGNSTLQWAAGNTQDISTSSKLRIEDGITATLDTGGNNVTLGTAIVTGTAKSAGLLKTGSGMLTVNAANSYAGGTTVRGGTLQLGNNTALGSSSGALTVNAGLLDLAGHNPSVASLSGSTGIVANSSFSPATLDVGGLATTTFSGSLRDGAGPLGLQLDGATLTLAGSNAHSGPTTINSGSLIAAAANVLSASSAMTVNGGLLDVTAGPQTISALTMGSVGSLNLSISNLLTVSNLSSLTGTLNVFGTTSGSVELVALPSGYGGPQFSTYNFMSGLTGYTLSYKPTEIDLVAVTGPATWSSSGGGSWATPGNWSSGTSPSGQGVTAILGSAAMTPVAITLDGAATLGALVFDNTNGYSLTSGSAGTLTMDNTTGGTADASIIVLSGMHSIASSLTLAGTNTSVALSAGGSLGISGNILDGHSGNAALTLSSSDGTGLLTLSGTNSFGGGMFVNSGTVLLNGAGSLLAGTSLTIGSPSPGSVFAPPSANSPAASPNLAPVPEPGTLVLLLVLALAIGWRRWRCN